MQSAKSIRKITQIKSWKNEQVGKLVYAILVDFSINQCRFCIFKFYHSIFWIVILINIIG